MFKLRCLACFLAYLAITDAQDSFKLPNLNREAPKPTVPPDLASFFQLPDYGIRRFVDSSLPGFIPPATFEVADPYQQQQSLLQNGNLGVLTASNKFNSPATSSFDITDPNTWNFAALTGSNGEQSQQSQVPNGLSVQQVNRPKGNSSISGIPNVFPSLPKAPIPQVEILIIIM